jgi:carboxypeptidase C (cathepsin A)
MRHSLDHMPLAEAYRKNVKFAEFDAGHMMYINQPDLQKLQSEIENFVRP